MTNQAVASRYAKSLIELAQSLNLLEEVHNDMALIAQVAADSRQFRQLLHSPIIAKYKKTAAIKALLGQHVTDLTYKFIDLLTNKGRESDLIGIAEAYQRQYNKLKGYSIATVTTAVAIDDALRTKFKSLVTSKTGKQVTLKELVDPSIKGGFILKMEDQQIDSSIKSRVADLRLKLIDTTYIPKL